MPYLIKHQDGTLMGFSTNKPGEGNLLPDGTPEVHQYYEDEVGHKDYDAAAVAELEAFNSKCAEVALLAQKKVEAIDALSDITLNSKLQDQSAPEAVKAYAVALADKK